jgi:hypothetical protein
MTWRDDCRPRRVVHLLSVLWVLSMADLFFTVWAHRFTPFHEANPLARALLNTPAALVAFKLFLTATGSTIFWRLRPHGRAEAGLWAVVAAYVLLTIRWSQYTAHVIMMSGPELYAASH